MYDIITIFFVASGVMGLAMLPFLWIVEKFSNHD